MASRRRVGLPIVRNRALWITSYGAVGNGSTENTTAINNALAAGKTQGLPVYIPPGTYNHSGVLIADSVTLYGAGETSILAGTARLTSALRCTGTGTILFNFRKFIPSPGARGDGSSEDQHSVNANGWIGAAVCNNLTMMNVHIDHSCAAGFMSNTATNNTIWWNYINNTNADGLFHVEASTNANVQWNVVDTSGDDGFSATTYTVGKDVTGTWSNNTSINNTGARCLGFSGGGPHTITFNHFEGGRGCGLTPTSTWGSIVEHDTTLSNNTIKNTAYSGPPTETNGGGINLWNNIGTFTNVLVQNNQLINCAYAFIAANGSTNITGTVSNNDFYGPAPSAGTGIIHNNTSTTMTESANVYHGTSIPADMIPIQGGLNPNLRLSFPGKIITNAASTFSESTDRTTVLTTGGTGTTDGIGSITDASGNIWTILAGVVQMNGAPAGSTSSVLELMYSNHKVYQENTALNWWYWDGTTPWVSSAAP